MSAPFDHQTFRCPRCGSGMGFACSCLRQHDPWAKNPLAIPEKSDRLKPLCFPPLLPIKDVFVPPRNRWPF